MKMRTRSQNRLPPDANKEPFGAHFNPQTSCVCPLKSEERAFLTRTSWLIIIASRLPEDKICSFQESEQTRARCPVRVLTFFKATVSKMWTSAEFVPTDKKREPTNDEPIVN